MLRRFNRAPFVMFVCMLMVCLLTSAPAASQSFLAPLRVALAQDAQLCSPDNPTYTPVSETKVEQIDDLTARVDYTNALGQTFSILITANGQEGADKLKEFIAEAKICYEAVQGTPGVKQDEVSDIEFGDIFASTIDQYNPDREAIQNYLTENPQEGTLRNALEKVGISADEVFKQAVDAASSAIDQAVSEGRLNPDVAKQFLEEATQTYQQLLDEPGIPTYPDPAGGNVQTGSSLNFEVTLVNPPDGGAYSIVVAVDPSLGYYGTNVWSLTTTAWIRVCFNVTKGRVNGALYNTSRYAVWSRTQSAVSSICSSWYQARRLVFTGLTTSNYYTMTSNIWSAG